MASSIHGSLSMYETRGCPRSKMNVGVPFYGMVFNSVAPGPLKIGIGAKFTPVNYDTTRKYPEMLALLREPGWKVYYDNSTWSRSQTQVGYNAVTKQFATFETPWSVTQKRNYALQTGAGGLLYWALGMDDASNSLLKAAMPVPIARGTAGGRDNGRGPIDSSNTILVGKLLVEGKGGK